LISQKRFIRIELLGNPFQGVVSEAIKLTYNENFSDFIEIVNNEENYKINYIEKIEKDF
jgi:hypothetical protein